MNLSLPKMPTIITLLLAALLMSTSLQANASPQKNSMSFESWVERLRNHAFEKGVSIITLQDTFFQNKELPLSTFTPSAHAELNEETLQNHLNISHFLLNEYNDALFEISHLFGVDRHVLAAIASMEEEQVSPYPAIDILINRSFLQPNNSRLQYELIQALKIIDDGQIDIEQLKSDFKGNLGKTNFKPSIFRDFAIDYDADGRYDLWQNNIDIFASTANYLSNIGWQTGAPWGIEVLIPETLDPALININQQYNLENWRKMGVFQVDGNELPNSTAFGALIKINENKHYIVLDNYFALLRWKRSADFAYHVGQLIDLMKPSKSFDDAGNSE